MSSPNKGPPAKDVTVLRMTRRHPFDPETGAYILDGELLTWPTEAREYKEGVCEWATKKEIARRNCSAPECTYISALWVYTDEEIELGILLCVTHTYSILGHAFTMGHAVRTKKDWAKN